MAVYKYLVVAIIVTSIVLREGESENSHPKKRGTTDVSARLDDYIEQVSIFSHFKFQTMV